VAYVTKSPPRGPLFFFLATASVLLLAGCLGPTPYQVKQLNGGYQERATGENRWYVEFYGNGFTTRDTVMVYWLHRCAELTLEKGYDYFVYLSRTAPGLSGARFDVHYATTAAAEDDPLAVRAKGAGGYVPIFVPGGSVTTWSARGLIEMRKGVPGPDETRALVARDLIQKLGPLVRQATQSGTNVPLPADFAGADETPPRATDGGGIGVRLDDLKDLLPKE